MAGFWYPYDGFNDAQVRLCAFANSAVGPQCGVSFSDGASIAVVRQPAGGSSGRSLWLNVLAQHVASPPPTAATANGITGKLKAWFWRAMELEGEAEIQNAEAQTAASQAMIQEFRDEVWQPAHQFLLRHKLMADTAGVALDAVGVAAGIVFLVVAAPELVAAGTALATAGLITGFSAAIGSFVLFGIDSVIYGAETLGNEAMASKLEGNRALQWMRIGATVMLLPDVAVGGMRSLQEIGKLGAEASKASASSAEALRSAEAAQTRVAKISNPGRHPGPVNRRIHKVRMFEQEATAQTKAVESANNRLRRVAVRDVALFQGATLAGTGLISAAPPVVAMTAEQSRRDDEYEKSLIPHGGMPKDVRFEIRMIGYSRQKTP